MIKYENKFLRKVVESPSWKFKSIWTNAYPGSFGQRCLCLEQGVGLNDHLKSLPLLFFYDAMDLCALHNQALVYFVGPISVSPV